MKNYDTIVIGGGFSGLSMALTLAKNGLKVGVLERKKEIGLPTHTSGIFIRKLIEDFSVPKEVIDNYISGFTFYSPFGKKYTMKFKGSEFFHVNIPKYEKELANKCKQLKVDFYLNTNCTEINIKENLVKVNKKYKSKTLALCCGSDTNFVKELLDDRVRKFLVGIEFLCQGINVKIKDLPKCFFDYNIAPGYGLWLAPIKNNVSRVGLCRYFSSKINLKEELKNYIKKNIKSNFKIKEIRSGLIPISGPIKKTYGNRFVVVGDAAGQIGALSAGGIHYALNIGRIAGEIISKNINNPTEESLKEYEKLWKKKYYKLLKIELILRKIYDRLDSNEKIENFIKILETDSFIKLGRCMAKMRMSKIDYVKFLLTTLTKFPLFL